MKDKDKEYKDRILKGFRALIDFYRMEYTEDLMPLFQDFGYLLIGALCQENGRGKEYFRIADLDTGDWFWKFKNEVLEEIEGTDLYESFKEFQLSTEKISVLNQMLQILMELLDIWDKAEDEQFLYETVREIYELCIHTKRDVGRYVLPDSYVKLLAQILDLEKSSEKDKEDFAILDPQAGAGTMLIAAGEYWTNGTLWGYEGDKRMQKSLEIFSVLSGREIHRVEEDFLSDGAEKTYDIIFANPCFTKEKIYDERSRMEPSVRIQSAYGLFLLKSLKALSVNGMEVLIVPDSFLFSTKVEFVDIRKWIFTKYRIEAVLSLPKNIFRNNSSVKSSVLIIRNEDMQPTSFMQEEIWEEKNLYIFFYDLSVETEETLIDRWNQREGLFQQWIQESEEEAENYHLMKTPENWKFQELWFAEQEAVIASKWNLLPDYYKPVQKQILEFGNPEEVLEGLIEEQQELLADMEELLREVRNL